MKIAGYKKKELFDTFISNFIPETIEVYCEPFGGEFSIFNYLNPRPKISIYNDINTYDVDISANLILHLDYKKIFDTFDNMDVVWYLDPPYYKKEYLYDGCKDYTEEFHIELRNKIKKLKGKVILSYGDVPFIRNLYKGFKIHKYDGNKFRYRNELIITNF